MRTCIARHQGFTFIEVAIAMSIMVIAVALAIGGFSYTAKSARRASVQAELDIGVQQAMERIKADMRLSALNHMVFYPDSAGPYEAVSFPMARDDDGDGALEKDGNDKIEWDRTRIYHVWSGEPSQLRLTTFDPRNNNLSQEQRQLQIDTVVATGEGVAAPNGANATTEILFENLFNWKITPNGSTYDGYADILQRDMEEVLGTCVLSSGPHTFEFRVIGKDSSSTGYQVGIDSLFASPSYSPREGEAQLPVTAQYGAAAISQYMSGGSWGGNHQLLFPASSVGHTVTLTLNNDQWEETNFRGTGHGTQDAKVIFDENSNPKDFVVVLDGLGSNWVAAVQTSDEFGRSSTNDVKGSAVRVLLRGDEMESGGYILLNGGRCKANFKAGASGSGLEIESVYIAEAADHTNTTMDAAGGTEVEMLASAFQIPAGADMWTGITDFPIDKNKSYVVTFLVKNATGWGSAHEWDELNDPAVQECFIIPGSNSPTLLDLADPLWSTRSDVLATNGVIALQSIFTTYPTNGFYDSRIFDTHNSAPSYKEMLWNDSTPSNTTIRMKVRSGNAEDLSDAADWSSVPNTGQGWIAPGDKRYIQFQAQLRADPSGFATPQLKDVTIDWTGESTMVDIGGTFTKGPDYGIFQLRVDGEPLKMGVSIDLEIYKEVLGHRGKQMVTSGLTTEIEPRNTGK